MKRGCPDSSERSKITSCRYAKSASSGMGASGTSIATASWISFAVHRPETGMSGRRSRSSCHRSTARSAKARARSGSQSRSVTGDGRSIVTMSFTAPSRNHSAFMARRKMSWPNASTMPPTWLSCSSIAWSLSSSRSGGRR